MPERLRIQNTRKQLGSIHSPVMKVLVLGMPRTGTQSIADALIELGILPTYHMREVGKNNHQALWVEAIDSKFEGKGEPWGREQFDKILGDYEAGADIPFAIFPEELVASYPEASIILTTRDEDKWFESMMKTLWHQHTHRPNPDPSPLAPLGLKYHKHCWGDDFPTHGREAYRIHNQKVREASKGRKFLDYETGSGWGPLCEFLGVDVPSTPYPRNDDWIAYKKKVEKAEQKEES